MMRHDETSVEVDRLFDRVWRDTGVTRQELCAPTRLAFVTEARQEVMEALCLMGYTTASAGRILSRDHSTVTHGRHAVTSAPDRLERSKEMAAGLGFQLAQSQFIPYLRRQVSVESDITAMLAYLSIYVEAIPAPRQRNGPLLATGRQLIATRYGDVVQSCLEACGLAERWPAVSGSLSVGRRSA